MIATNPITNTEDILYARDMLERIEYLELSVAENTEEELEEFRTLDSILSQVKMYSGADPKEGARLIRDSYFSEYVEEQYRGEIGVDRNHWLFTYIDWEAVADDLKQDYANVYFDGVEYWVSC
jgi:hypothetical protein